MLTKRPINPQEKTPGNTPGFPSIEEQETYWKQKDTQQQINDKIGQMLDVMNSTMRNMLGTLSGLRDICEHQQKEIDALKRK